MDETGRSNAKTPGSEADETEIMPARLSGVVETAAYAAQVKSLTNYEVLRNVESALLTLGPSREMEATEWWKLRILLDELKWRLSGLEGPDSPSSRIQVNTRQT
ncbi:MAG TPA: hypothetical protein VNJ52_10440 [Patescibacteria group bacterium]|nr:hypothetical protein [Patescibacteria group bacterium]